MALEPEAASIYCQRESAEKLSFGQQKKLTKPGTRYLVADIGGIFNSWCIHIMYLIHYAQKVIDEFNSAEILLIGNCWGNQ